MYIFSFIKSLFKPRHIPATIYLLINDALIFFFFYFFVPLNVYPDEVLNKVFCGLIGLAVNLLFVLISLTPFGEWLWRVINGVKRQPHNELMDYWNKANEVFEEVKGKAVAIDKHVSKKVKLYYSPTNDINAFALGHRTVIITYGMLCVNFDYMKGAFAHELGHISHGDSDLRLGINVANVMIAIFMTLFSIIANIIIGFTANGEVTSIIAVIVHVIFNVIILGLFRLWCMLGVLLLNSVSRKEEFLADNYAKTLGYEKNLAEFLYALDGNATKTNKFSLMFQTHPDTSDRIRNLGFEVA